MNRQYRIERDTLKELKRKIKKSKIFSIEPDEMAEVYKFDGGTISFSTYTTQSCKLVVKDNSGREVLNMEHFHSGLQNDTVGWLELWKRAYNRLVNVARRRLDIENVKKQQERQKQEEAKRAMEEAEEARKQNMAALRILARIRQL